MPGIIGPPPPPPVVPTGIPGYYRVQPYNFKVSTNFPAAQSWEDLANLTADAFRQVENHISKEIQTYVVSSANPDYPTSGINFGSILIDQTVSPYIFKTWNGQNWVVLIPSGALGCLFYINPAGTISCLPPGTEGQTLKIVNGIPTWTS